MTNQITLEEATELVRFHYVTDLGWRVHTVTGTIDGDVIGDIYGNVVGTIDGRNWKFVETPKDKLQRLIGGASEE